MATDLTKLTSDLLTERNYATWAKSAMLAISGRGKLGWITGKYPATTIRLSIIVHGGRTKKAR